MAYTNIDDPSAYFQTAIYTGDGNDDRQVTNDGNSDLKPDWVWLKDITQAQSHALFDSTRGATKRIQSNSTGAESTETATLKSFTTDGFTLGTSSTINNGSNPDEYVAWQWKANGGTTASNSDGSIASTVQANTDAGFSIVTFTSPASSGTGIFSVGHGLGQIPAMVITKSREGTSNWWSWHKGLTGGNSNTSYIIALERISVEASYSNAWGAGMTSSVFGMQSGNTAVASKDYVAYCFAEKQGFSKFGTYVGNGNANGPFVYTGFKPAFVMLKNRGATTNWYMWDNKRNPHNFVNNGLNPNTSNTTQGAAYESLDFLSNGFKIRAYVDGTWNGSANTYIYMAFAENPFTTSTGIPTTAR